jgi:S-adenosylmethionine decarboxylase
MNGDHWLVYIARPLEYISNTPTSTICPLHGAQLNGAKVHSTSDETTVTPKPPEIDTTIEILMTNLPPVVSRAFHFPEEPSHSSTPFDRARQLSSDLGITDLFPPQLTTLDSYAFSPCGYSANALIKWGDVGSSPLAEDREAGHGAEGYYTIHVTPEDGWSYASFECNIPLSPVPAPHSRHMPDLGTLVRRVVGIFRPARLTLTLFISSPENDEDEAEEEAGESAIEAAQRVFKTVLAGNSPFLGNADNGYDGVYTRTDKINYHFGDYDLAFASFELAAS